MKTWKVQAETVVGVTGLWGKLFPVAPCNASRRSVSRHLIAHKSGSEKGSRRATEQGGVWPCLLVHPRVSTLHFSFTQRRLLAFISPRASSVYNYSFSLHMVGDHKDSSIVPHSVFSCNVLSPGPLYTLHIRLPAPLFWAGGPPRAWQTCCTGCFGHYQKTVPNFLHRDPSAGRKPPLQPEKGPLVYENMLGLNTPSLSNLPRDRAGERHREH